MSRQLEQFHWEEQLHGQSFFLRRTWRNENETLADVGKTGSGAFQWVETSDVSVEAERGWIRK